MINQEILDYIKNQLANGKSKEEIHLKLGKVGWLKEDIDQAFTEIASPQTQSKTKSPLFQEDKVPQEAKNINSPYAEEMPYSRPIESQVSNTKTINSNKGGLYGILKIILILLIVFIIAAGIGLGGYFLMKSEIIRMPIKESLTPEQIAQRSFINLSEAPDIEIKSNSKISLKSSSGEVWTDMTFLVDLKADKEFANDRVDFGNIEAMIDILVNLNLKTIENNLPEIFVQKFETKRQEMMKGMEEGLAEIYEFLNIQDIESFIGENLSINTRIRTKLLNDDAFFKLDDIRIN
ncbi:MAG TPA: hypothetical protein ENN31_00495, partial [Candidatus Vogelbacteria bacterium]|nr:hypothetical protein [Candidatus Vogelbacteria bacterium]